MITVKVSKLKVPTNSIEPSIIRSNPEKQHSQRKQWLPVN